MNDSEMKTAAAPARMAPTFDCCMMTKTRTTAARTINNNALSRARITLSYGGS